MGGDEGEVGRWVGRVAWRRGKIKGRFSGHVGRAPRVNSWHRKGTELRALPLQPRNPHPSSSWISEVLGGRAGFQLGLSGASLAPGTRSSRRYHDWVQ